MTTAYYIEMDNGTQIRITAISCSQAIQQAIEENIGCRVFRAWSGSPSRDLDVGFIEYDIPAHDPLNAAPPQKEAEVS